jgi:hypothetical protein
MASVCALTESLLSMLQIGRNNARRKFGDESGNTTHQLACGEHSEGNGGDVLGFNTACEEHRDAASHDRGLARASSSFNQ